MSELQLSLIAIGAMVVAGVYAFNWVQQRRYRRKLEQAFGPKPEDVLFRSGKAEADAGERIEPQLQELPDNLPEEQTPFAPLGIAVEPVAPGVENGGIDYLVEIRLPAPAMALSLSEALQRKFDFGKPVTWTGLNPKSENWEGIAADSAERYGRLRAGLQLADRSGAVSEVKLAEFRDMVLELAGKLDGEVECPDVEEAAAAAAALDQFCAEVDVMIGLNVVSKDGGAFTGTKIRGLAEASGFKLGPDSVFKYVTEAGEHLFSLSNFEANPFLPDTIKHFTTRGITLILDVPRVARGEHAFDQMVVLARQFAHSLGGMVVDDNRVPLNETGVAKIKEQLRSIQAKMSAYGIPAGSPRALRLFA